MKRLNPTLLCDFYKLSHVFQYPEGTEPHSVDQAGATDEPKTAHGAGKESDGSYHDAQIATSHKEIAR